MSRYVFKLPDLGEGTVSAEVVNWHVKPGDTVAEEQVLVEVMTEKAAVEVPSPVSGTVISTSGEPGELVAVGSELIVLETGDVTGDVARGEPPAGPARAPGAATRSDQSAAAPAVS
ncbi:branched-chain alpha-keto acid dehydrogenase subunit E2, partial [mine drainage metagenome]